MRIAIPTWLGNVSPVLDVARNLLVVDVEASEERSRRQEPLAGSDVWSQVARLRALGLDVLICGAVSQHLEQALVSSGIKVYSQVCGGVDEVLRAFLAGRIGDPAFLMPGCGRCRRRSRDRSGRRGFGRQVGAP